MRSCVGARDREQILWQFYRGECYGKIMAMARKKKLDKFEAVQAVKELARERVGAPPVGKIVPHKKKNDAKHKATLEKLLEESE